MSGTTTGGGGGHDPVILKRGERDVSITVADLDAIVAALPDGILKDVINHLLTDPPASAVDTGNGDGTVDTQS